MSLNPAAGRATLGCADGFALVEVLCTFFVLAFGLLGIANLLIVTGKLGSSSYLKQHAVQSTYEIIDRMRANSGAAAAHTYDVNDLTSAAAPVPPTVDCSQAACTSSQMAAYDDWVWLSKEIAFLPRGGGSIQTSVQGTNTLVTVTVQWDDGPAQGKFGAATSDHGAAPNLSRFVVETLL